MAKRKTKRERILELADGTRTAREIAKKVGTSQGYASRIIWEFKKGGTTRSWTLKKPNGPQKKARRNKAIIKAYLSGETGEAIGKRFGITAQRVHEIVQAYG